MLRNLKSINVLTAAAVFILTILTIAIQFGRHNGQATRSSSVHPSSSESKPENNTANPASEITCVANGTNSAGVKPSTTPVAPGQKHHVDLSWKASTSPGIPKYNVHRCAPGGPCVVIQSIATTNYSDDQVEPLREYCYFITAVAAAGGPDSGPSNVIHVVIRTP